MITMKPEVTKKIENVIERIQDDLAAIITPSAITAVERSLLESQEGEKPLGVVTNEHAKKLWALANYYGQMRSELIHTLRFDSPEEEERKQQMVMWSNVTGSLEDTTRDLAWVELRFSVGETAWTAGSIGLRKGWTLVSDPEEREHHVHLPKGLMALLGGGFVELAKGLAKDLEKEMEKEKQTPPKEPS